MYTLLYRYSLFNEFLAHQSLVYQADEATPTQSGDSLEPSVGLYINMN